ncbi:MAG: hypothetical protein KDD34_01960, partial [Bdellovibrionales bacterium]|nr:hypothetical protein [Bdellovibrionales bacterium]
SQVTKEACHFGYKLKSSRRGSKIKGDTASNASCKIAVNTKSWYLLFTCELRQLFFGIGIIFCIALGGLFGCGVKGDPLPPEKAPRLGRGHPTYSGASEYVSPDYTTKKKVDAEEEE